MIERIKTARGVMEVRIETPQRANGRAVLVLNGGHTDCRSRVMHQDLLLTLGYQLVIPSRPGYGRTPSATGRSAEAAADACAALLDCLGIRQAVVMGISAAGPTALQLAGRHPERVEQLVLECAVVHEWLSRKQLVAARTLFNPVTELAFWALFRTMLNVAPRRTLAMLMQNLTVLDAREVIAGVSEDDVAHMLSFHRDLRSRGGFWNDIGHSSGNLSRISAPTLVIHSRHDGSNPFTHAEYAARHIGGAELFASEAESHLIWFSAAHAPQVDAKLADFLQARSH